MSLSMYQASIPAFVQMLNREECWSLSTSPSARLQQRFKPSERKKGYLSPVTAPGWAAVPQHGGVEHANTVTGSKATISLRSVAHFENLATVCGVKSLCGISARSIG